MNNDEKILPFASAELLDAEATTWVVRLDREDLPDEVRHAFEAWRGQSDRHREAFERAVTLWGNFDKLKTLRTAQASKLTKPTLLERVGLEIRHRIALAGGLAAATAVAISLIVNPSFVDPSQDILQVHRTVIGSQKTVLLSDSSELLLNTDSEVQVELKRDSRIVHLRKGEVHFTVAPDKRRPFSVYVENRVVTAVGTAFAVHRKEDRIEITVTEGGVNLYILPQEMGVSTDVIDPPNNIPLANLTAGETAVMGDKVETVEAIAPPELNRKLAWRQGLLAFAGEPLSQVIAEVTRYTDIKIVIKDPSLKELRFGGFLKVGNVDTLFNALEQSFGVKVDGRGGTTVYLSSSSS